MIYSILILTQIILKALNFLNYQLTKKNRSLSSLTLIFGLLIVSIPEGLNIEKNDFLLRNY